MIYCKYRYFLILLYLINYKIIIIILCNFNKYFLVIKLFVFTNILWELLVLNVLKVLDDRLQMNFLYVFLLLLELLLDWMLYLSITSQKQIKENSKKVLKIWGIPSNKKIQTEIFMSLNSNNKSLRKNNKILGTNKLSFRNNKMNFTENKSNSWKFSLNLKKKSQNIK